MPKSIDTDVVVIGSGFGASVAALRFSQAGRRVIMLERGNWVSRDSFEVDLDANKVQIRQAIEKVFGVRVASVRTQIVRGKMKRLRRSFGKRPNWKKAVVTLREGDTIELFEGA